MSRSPLRDLFRLVHSGLEKVALACAAFGLMHVTARAGESAPSSAPVGEQWSSHAAPQPAADDPWSNPSAPRVAIDDAWSTPEWSSKMYSTLPPLPLTQEPLPAALKSAPHNEVETLREAPRALAMDRSGWNETPRGRSPGLIASHDAWLKRTTPVVQPSEPPKAPKAPKTPMHDVPPPDVDPWSAPWLGLIASNAVSTPAPTVSSRAFDTRSRPDSVVSPNAALPRVGEAGDASPAEASTPVFAAGRPMHRRTRPILHSTANASRSSGTKRARATKSAKAPSRAWCRAASASARYR